MSKERSKQELEEVDESETKKNYEYSVKMMRRLLKSVGMWPETSQTYPSILRSFLIAVMWFLLGFYMIPGLLHTFLYVKGFKARTRNLGPHTFGTMNVIKFAIMIRRRKDLRECLDWLSSDWRNVKMRVENDIMLVSAKTGVTFTTTCVTFMMISGLSYSSVFSFIQEPSIVNNVSLKPFAYPVYFIEYIEPYDYFYTIYTIQSTCGLAMFTATAGIITSIAIAVSMHIVGQISVISHLLHNLASGTFNKEIFRYIIGKHLRALRLAKKLESLLSGVCLVEFVGFCFLVCVLGYYTITEFSADNNLGPYTYCLMIISFTFDIFAFCYIGEELSSQCSNVGSIVYDVDWYYLSPTDSRSLLMIIVSTNRPVVLTAGKMANLQMSSFSTFLKASLSYLNMLRTMTTY